MNINLSCPINNLGYGVASQQILYQLCLMGHRVSLFPIGPIEAERPDIIQQCLNHALLCDWNAPSVRIYHQNSLAQHVGNGPKIGFPFFELDRFTQEELHHLRNQDAIIVSSEWARQIIYKHVPGVTKVDIVPLGVNPSIFHPSPVKSVGGPT